jgi:hypothetical protein
VNPLFFQDSHYEDIPTFGEPSAILLKQLRELALLHFKSKLKPRPTVKVINGANINSGNFLIDDFYLKIFTLSDRLDYVETFPAIVECLHKAGLPTARFVLSDAGYPVTLYTNLMGKRSCIYLQECVEGHYFTGTMGEIKACLSLLQQLPIAVEELLPTVGQRAVYGSWDPQKLLAHLEPRVLEAQAAPNEFDVTAAHHWETAKDIVCSSFRADIRLDKLNHIDLHPHNLLMKGSRVACVLDLESFWAIPPEMSIGFALFKLGRKSVSKGHLSADEVKSLFKQEFDTSTLLPFAQFEIARRFLTILKLHYIDNDFRWDADINKQANSFAEVRKLF